MSKRTNLVNVTNTYDNTGIINTNLERLNSQFDNTISRDGSSPNAMEADLDMNSNDILNVKDLHIQGDLKVDGVGGFKEYVEEAKEARDETVEARDKAQEWAENPVDVAVEPGQFSALHWAAKAEGIASTVRPSVPSYTSAHGSVIPSDIKAIEVLGHTAEGDGGAAQYKAVSAEPSHPFKFQSGDGRWWEIVIEGQMNAAQFGVGIGGTDDSTLSTAMFDFLDGREVIFPQSEYNYPAPDGYDIYIFAGGGNINGIGNNGPLVSPVDDGDPRILETPFVTSSMVGAVSQASVPFSHPEYTTTAKGTNVDPCMSILKILLPRTPSNRGIIAVPAGWSGVDLVNGSAGWALGNGRSDATLTALSAAVAHGGGDNRLRGIFWSHGESDATAGVSGSDYVAALKLITDAWRAAAPNGDRAWLTILGPPPEWESLGLGSTTDLFDTLRQVHKHIDRASFVNGPIGYSDPNLASRYTAPGQRTRGGGTRLWMTMPPDELSAFYYAPDGSRALYKAGVTFTPAQPRNIKRRTEYAQVGGVAKRDVEILYEDNDDYRWVDSFGQWDSSPVPNNRPRNYFAVSKYWEDADPIDSLTTTFFQSVGEQGGANMLNSLATFTAALGEQTAWGAVFVVGTGENVRIPEGNPPTLIGVEIDMQPSEGTDVQSGAGLLVNSFVDPVNFAGVAIVGDAGGEWKEGIFAQNIRNNILLASGSLSCENGIHLAGGTYSNAAILLGSNDYVKFRGAGTATATDLYSTTDNYLNMQLEAGFRIRGRSASGENETALLIETRSPNFTEVLKVNSATGVAANAANSALRVRANSVTSRSINAGGTINASGADYAEYEYKREDCGDIIKGQIIGFDADGLLTDKWSEAIRFGVKSTAPNIVGGDTWADEAGPEPVAPQYECRIPAWGGGDRPHLNNNNAHMAAEIKQRQAEWDEAREAWEAECEADRADWDATVYADYQAEYGAWFAECEKYRAKVDRIAYCGKVPVNVSGAEAGEHIVPVQQGDGIGAAIVSDADITFDQYRKSVGRVGRVLPDGRAELVVKV